MLTIVLPGTEDLEPAVIHLEHSLSSLSKWESIYEKPFFGKDAMTPSETRVYVIQMVTDPFPPANIADRLSDENIQEINAYINSKQSATWFNELNGPDGESTSDTSTITSELMYYWMIQFKIDWSCEHWHINRLMTLIKICGIKMSPPKKMSPTEHAAYIREVNAKRLKEMGTSG